MKRRSFILFIVFTLCLSLLCALPCAALDNQHVITYDEAQLAADAARQHAWAFTSNYDANTSRQLRLNVYSTGALYNNCRVTTYLNDNTRLQWWGIASIDGEGSIYCSFQDANFSLQIYREGAAPEASVYRLAGNRFGDVNLQGWSAASKARTFYAAPRYIHTSVMYLQETSTVPGAGGGKYCRWAPSGATTFYSYDVSLGRY
ncbi:MAG: hypothetical protein Q4G07_03095 [Oscillospiraceae bacterium]|nr:hypothetical protein [Oscillospiraceae bacterium]